MSPTDLALTLPSLALAAIKKLGTGEAGTATATATPSWNIAM